MAGENWKTVYLFTRRELPQDDPTRGLSQEQYAAWCEAHGSPVGDVKLITEPTVEQVYFVEYWQPWGQALPSGVDVIYFSAAVYYGPVHAIVKLQEALGITPVSGYLGLVTLAATMRADRKQLINKYVSGLIAEFPAWTQRFVELQGIALGLV